VSEGEVQQQSTAVARWNLCDQGCSRLTRRRYVKEYLFLSNIVTDTECLTFLRQYRHVPSVVAVVDAFHGRGQYPGWGEQQPGANERLG
jgi:hypothetical protein